MNSLRAQEKRKVFLKSCALRHNQVNLLGLILSQVAMRNDECEKVKPDQLRNMVENIIDETHQRLLPVINDARTYSDRRTSIMHELDTRQRMRLELSWELYWQKSHLLSLLKETVKQKVEKCTGWRQQQVDYMISYIDTIHLKMISIEEKCMQQMYNAERSEVLEYISDLLDSRIQDERTRLNLLHSDLEELERLPKAFVAEYVETQDKISNLHEYFARLQAAD